LPKRCQQHPGNMVWLPRPVRTLSLRVKCCSSFQTPAYGEIVIYACVSTSPRVDVSLCVVSIPPPRCGAGETWGLWLQQVVEIVANFPICFCAFHGNSRPHYTHYTFGQTGRAIYIATFAISVGTTWRCCCGHICEGETMHWC